MIGFLRGVVLHAPRTTSEPIVVDVQGVGYEVSVARPATFVVGEDVSLFVRTIVRPDALILYGFESAEDRVLFEMLLATPGVGPATALAALRTFSSHELLRAIEAEDVKLVGTIGGIGPKTASRIVLELKGKLVVPATSDGPALVSARLDIEEALRGWGYAAAEVREALANVDLPDDPSDALKVALAALRRG